MRKSALGLAFVAATQLSLVSSHAFADGTGHHDVPGPEQGQPEANNKGKHGWLVLGIGAGVTIAGVIIDCVGLTKPSNAPGEMGTTTTNARTNFFWGGTSLIVAGIVTGIIGGSMVANPNQNMNGDPEKKPSEPAASNDAVSHAVTAALQSAPTVMVPILGTTF